MLPTYLLAIDTTSAALTLALLERGELRAGRHEETGRRHAERLLPAIQEVLAEAKVAHGDLDAIGVTLGPGGFTSVRVGLATAKGLCLARPRALYATSSLAALAFGGEGDGDRGSIAVATKAYRGEVYAAAYARSSGALDTLVEPFHAPPEEAARRCAAAGACLALGAGAREHAGIFRDAGVEFAAAERDELSPSTLAAALMAEVRAGRRRDPDTLVPEYIRPPDAALPRA